MCDIAQLHQSYRTRACTNQIAAGAVAVTVKRTSQGLVAESLGDALIMTLDLRARNCQHINLPLHTVENEACRIVGAIGNILPRNDIGHEIRNTAMNAFQGGRLDGLAISGTIGDLMIPSEKCGLNLITRTPRRFHIDASD